VDLDTDTFSHTGAGGSSPGTRCQCGYVFTAVWPGARTSLAGHHRLAQLISTIMRACGAVFAATAPRQHLNDTFQEVRRRLRTGGFGSTTPHGDADFAKSGTGAFLTGVAYTDTDGNDFLLRRRSRGGVQGPAHASAEPHDRDDDARAATTPSSRPAPTMSRCPAAAWRRPRHDHRDAVAHQARFLAHGRRLLGSLIMGANWSA